MKILTPTARANTFEEMNLPSVLMTALGKMEITKPTAVQSQAISIGIEGCDLIAIAQTGSGKTLAYALSLLTALTNKPKARALVMAPSREMAQQIYDVFVKLCAEMPISNCLVIGGMPNAKQVSQLKKIPRIIVATPGRLYDHLLTNKLLLQGVEVVVIDEADRMLDMGFSPQLTNIQKTMRGVWQTVMFSASFSPSVENIAKVFMRDEVYMVRAAAAEAPVSSLKQRVLFVNRGLRNDCLIKELKATNGAGTIVFTDSQETCEYVGAFLSELGLSVEIIHGTLSTGHRTRVMREFRAGDFRILVATDLLARGLDVSHIEYVINYDLPYKSEDFLHRIGRTARAGRGGSAITLVLPTDTRSYRRIKPYLKGATEESIDPGFAFVDEKAKRFEDGYRGPSKKAKNEDRTARFKSASAGDGPKKPTSQERKTGFVKKDRPRNFDYRAPREGAEKSESRDAKDPKKLTKPSFKFKKR
jgi:ATP-dependent RNA helicase RhlE